MHGSTTGLRDDPAELTALASQRPELAAWLRPLGVALAAARAEPWRSLAPVPAPVRDPGAPLLHEAILPVEPGALRALVAAVLAEALGPSEHQALARLDPFALLRAAAAHEDEEMGDRGAAAGVDGAALAVAAQLAALPLLQGCGRALAHRVEAGWEEGYCPVCGAWPSLVEVRGLERSRVLRCGRCGSSWTTEVLLCSFCGERDHGRLAALVPEGVAGQTAWVETCTSCRGYLKAVALLRGMPADAVLLKDAATIELDLAAAERGFQRPAGAGFHIDCHVVASAGVPSA